MQLSLVSILDLDAAEQRRGLDDQLAARGVGVLPRMVVDAAQHGGRLDVEAPVARHADLNAAQHGGNRELPFSRRQLGFQQVDLGAAQDVGDVAALELAAGDAAVEPARMLLTRRLSSLLAGAGRALPGSGTGVLLNTMEMPSRMSTAGHQRQTSLQQMRPSSASRKTTPSRIRKAGEVEDGAVVPQVDHAERDQDQRPPVAQVEAEGEYVQVIQQRQGAGDDQDQSQQYRAVGQRFFSLISSSSRFGFV